MEAKLIHLGKGLLKLFCFPQNVAAALRNRKRVNPQVTPHTNAMLEGIENNLGNNYYQNALSRGDMIRTPDGRVVPRRPLTPADVESQRKELVAHLRDANNAARAHRRLCCPADYGCFQ